MKYFSLVDVSLKAARRLCMLWEGLLYCYQFRIPGMN